MYYRVVVPSDRSQDETTDDLDKAWLWCLDLSEEYGYAEVRYNQCGPARVLGSYTNGAANSW